MPSRMRTSDRFNKLPGAIKSADALEGARTGGSRDNCSEPANEENGGACDDDHSLGNLIETVILGNYKLNFACPPNMLKVVVYECYF